MSNEMNCLEVLLVTLLFDVSRDWYCACAVAKHGYVNNVPVNNVPNTDFYEGKSTM